MKKTTMWMFAAAMVAMWSLPAAAQTTMQQREAEEAGEEVEEDQPVSEDEQQRSTRADSSGDPADGDSSGSKAPGEDEDFVESQWSWIHVPGFRADFGFDFIGNRNLAIGLGYMYKRLWRVKILHTETYFRGGVGPDINFFFDDDRGFLSFALQPLVGRVTGAGPRGGMTIEMGGGFAWVPGSGAIPNVTVGAYYASEMFEVGYFHRLSPFANEPGWLTPHNIGLRLHIPLLEH